LAAYLVMMEPITPILHLAYLVFFLRLALYASWVRSPFEWFVTANYAMFLFLPFGWLWLELKKAEALALFRLPIDRLPIWGFGGTFGFSGLSLALTALVTYQWYLEAKRPQNVYEFRGISLGRWWVLLPMAWGVLYPFRPSPGPDRFDFMGWNFIWASPFGVLFAPTTIVFQGLLGLIFPRVNFQLFLTLNVVGLAVSLHTFAFFPLDLPMGALALYNFGLFACHRFRGRALAEATHPP
jgi:hypothetical protein